MSISTSLANALTGLTMSARAAELVSSNVSNAMTEGYGRRTLELTAQSVGGTGGGVQVVGVNRSSNPQLLGESRLASADLGHSSTRADFLQRVERAIGTPEDAGSLNGRIDAFEAALIEAASAPQSDTRLSAAVTAADKLADHLNVASGDIQQARMEADRHIGQLVEQLNSGLSKVVSLNIDIQSQIANGRDATALMDQRQVLVDQLSTIVPLREVQRPNGMIALFTTGGAILADTRPAEIGFQVAGTISADMTQQSGALSGLTINGQPISTASTGRSALGGGQLGALFEVRDELAVTAQSRLDSVARDLIERVATATVDPTLGGTDPGLFTDNGAALDPGDEVGLAGRIKVNSAVLPASGGAVWRLRDGVNASAMGATGDSDLLNALAQSLSDTRAPSSGDFSALPRSLSTLATEVLSLNNGQLLAAEEAQSFAQSQSETLTGLLREEGVDTDQEMQQLLLIEQAYSANAKVISTLDALLGQILEM